MTNLGREKLSPETLVTFLNGLPADYSRTRPPDSNDIYLLAVCEELYHGPAEANHAFAVVVNEQLDHRAGAHLTNYVARAAVLAVRQFSLPYLRSGFIALALNVPSDIEIFYMSMAVLNRSAEHLEVDASEYFQMAADRACGPYLTETLAAFPTFDSNYKSLKTFYLRELQGPSGIFYKTTRHNEIPEVWL